MDEDEIERLAVAEILSEAKRGAARAEVVGPQGWQKCPLPATNKRFLQNTLFGVIGTATNKDKSSKKEKLKRLTSNEKLSERNSPDDKTRRRNSKVHKMSNEGGKQRKEKPKRISKFSDEKSEENQQEK